MATNRVKAFRTNRFVRTLNHTVQYSSLLILAVLTWEFGVAYAEIPAFILPRPTIIVDEIVSNQAFYVENTLITVKEVILGLLVGGAFGVFSAIIIFYVDILRRTLYPFLAMNYVVPKIALAPLFVFWFGDGTMSKVLLVMLIVFFPLLVNTFTGLVEIDEALIELGRSFGLPEAIMLGKIRLPAALPYISTGFKLATVLAVIGAVVAEFVASSEGLGAVVVTATAMAQTTRAFSAVVITLIVSLVFYGVAVFLDKRLLFWYDESDSG